MQDFRKLAAWQLAHKLTLATYKVTKDFPERELYGLTSQVRRSAVSIAANIAEGCCRSGDAEFARFLHVALGSASELEYHLLLARDLGFLSPAGYRQLNDNAVRVKQMLTRLIRKLKNNDK